MVHAAFTRSLFFALILLLTRPAAWSQAVVPTEMERLRASYEGAREKAVRPLDERYLIELTKLKETYTRSAKLEEAIAVTNEIRRVRALLGLPQDETAPSLMPTSPKPPGDVPVAGNSAQGAQVVIPANSPNGLRLGPVKRGDTITLQYVSGLWKAHGGIATENPDAAKSRDEDRLVIAEAANAKGEEGKVLRIVPADTSLQPFNYVFQTTRDDVVLRINTNSTRKENPGQVTYTMKLVR